MSLLATLAVVGVSSAWLAATLIRALRPLLARYALARPNARSSHTVPTPQGGGIAVLAAALAAAAAGLVALGSDEVLTLDGLAAAAVSLGALGAVDDIRPLPAAPRLAAQLVAVAAVVAVLDPGRILPEAVPFWLERALMVLAGGWWVNAVNFMDGLDWLTVSALVPMTAALALLGLAGALPVAATFTQAALCGALLGFAPANRPVARLFLGDVGSLPVGLLTGAGLLALAGRGHLAAALLLPMHYLADTLVTFGLRASRGERVWEAHRSHFYQRATTNGFSVPAVDAHVFGLNAALAAMAAATVAWPAVSLPALAVGAGLTALVLRRFATRRSA